MKTDDLIEKLIKRLEKYGNLKLKAQKLPTCINNSSEAREWIMLSHEVCELVFDSIALRSGIQFKGLTLENLDTFDKLKKIPDEILSCMVTVSVYNQTYYNCENLPPLCESDAYICVQIAMRLLKWHDEDSENLNYKSKSETETAEISDKIIIWNDIPLISAEVSKNIALRITEKMPDLKPLIINSCEELIKLKISPELHLAIILLVTDQTKLSQNEKSREAINKILFNYVSDGGNIIGSHDLIYKRTKNKELQEIFGCTITDYFEHSSSAIEYNKCKNEYVPEEFKILPEQLMLYDGEAVTGIWGPATTTIFSGTIVDEHGKDITIPLVTLNDYGNSACIWLNSGHYHDAPPLSISGPQDEFIDIITAALKYFKRKKEEI